MARIVSGFTVGTHTPEQVLEAKGLAGTSVEALIHAAKAHDATNPGYLSKAELELGADDLANAAPSTPETPSAVVDTFEYSASVMASVKEEVLGGVARSFTNDEVTNAAALWDNGNGYLNRAEIRAGAKELELTSTSGAALSAADIASIRTWTGATRRDAPTPVNIDELGVISDIDSTLMPPEKNGVEPAAYPGVSTLVTLLEKGPQGTGALGDVTYVTARNLGRVATIPAWLTANQLPAGTIESGTVQFPLHVAENEKVKDIEGVFRAHPTQQFVLFGDTKHRDPDVYKRIRDMFPAQVKAVIIQDVRTIDAARLDGHHVVKNYAEAAAFLLKEGVIDEAGSRSVMVAAQAEGLEITDAAIDALIGANRP